MRQGRIMLLPARLWGMIPGCLTSCISDLRTINARRRWRSFPRWLFLGMQWRPHWDGEAWSCRSLSQVYPCLDEDQLNVLKETLNKIDILTYNAWWYNTHNRRRGAGGRRSCGKKYVEKSSLTYKFMKMHTCVCCSQFGMVHIFDSPMSSPHREY